MALSFLILLIIGMPLLVGFVLVCIKKPVAALVLFCSITVAILLVMGLGFFVSRSQDVYTQEAIATPIKVTNNANVSVHAADVTALRPAVADVPVRPSAVWSIGVDDEYMVDVYPSAEAAVKTLGYEVVKLAARLNDGTEPKWFETSRVSVSDTDTAAEFTRTIERAKGNPDNAVLTSAVGIEDVATIGLARKNISHIENVTSGTYEASVKIGGKESRIIAKYIEKPWVESLSLYSNANPGHDYAIARSWSSCTDTFSADSEAKQAAIDMVSRMMHQRYNDITYQIGWNELIEQKIANDNFEQKLSGGITDIYRKAVLLDLHPGKLMAMHSNKINETQARQIQNIVQYRQRNKNYANLIISFIGLIAVICGVYLFVNAATKGYYSVTLRIVLIGTALIGGVILLLSMVGIA